MSNEIRGLLLLSDTRKRLQYVHDIVDNENFILPIIQQDEFQGLHLSSGLYGNAKSKTNTNEVIISLLGSYVSESSAYYILSNLYNVVRPLTKRGDAIIVVNGQQMDDTLDGDDEADFDVRTIDYARNHNFGAYPLHLKKSPLNLDLAELKLRIGGLAKKSVNDYANQIHTEFLKSYPNADSYYKLVNMPPSL